MKKVLISSAVALSLLAPALSQAAGLSVTQMSAVTSLLNSFGVDATSIASVQSTLANASTTASTSTKREMKGCIALLRDLRKGSQGEDVKKLQERLRDEDAEFNSAPTGVFGPMTEKAVKRFQERHGVASTTTGNVGPMTRKFFERECGMEDKGKGDRGNDQMMSAAVNGMITTASSSTITVAPLQGSVRTVTIVASTTIKVFVSTSTAPTSGTFADLVVGRRVHVEGQKNADGTITARAVVVGLPAPRAGDREDN
jgi:peptidoglycan hydrolase-like protein with peptidoglycan-binding domain